MKKVYLLSLALLTVIFGCKNNSETLTLQNNTQIEKAKPSLIISINYKSDKIDVFKIMMNNIIVDEFQKKSIQFSEEVVPTSNFDNIEVKFDEDNFSKNIIVHLGNKNEKTVEIKDITVSFDDKVVKLSTPSDFNDFLVFNKFIDVDFDNKVIRTKKVDGKLYPTFSFRQKLINQLK